MRNWRKLQLNRAKLLFEDGAIPKSALETAQNAEDDARYRSRYHQRTSPPARVRSRPSHGNRRCVRAGSGSHYRSGDHNPSGVQALTPPNPFTISDVSHVWIVCDVYENDMAQVHVGEYADIHLAAYPNRVLKARICNILPIVDPNIRTAKVRLEVENPGLMRIGMFVTATFHGADGAKARHCASNRDSSSARPSVGLHADR